jgi:hypothetical protein
VLLAVAAAPVLLAAPAAAGAQSGDYIARSVTERAVNGLPVRPPLANVVALSKARVIVPTDWKALRAPAGELRLLTPPNRCRYRVAVSVRTKLAAPGAATDYVAAALPSPAPAYLLDSGQRGSSAFRVLRRPSTGGVVRVEGLRAGVLTRRADIVAPGQVAWTELRMTAVSLPGDECHSGTWRQRMGPQVGDALAAARSSLRFVRRPA